MNNSAKIAYDNAPYGEGGCYTAEIEPAIYDEQEHDVTQSDHDTEFLDNLISPFLGMFPQLHDTQAKLKIDLYTCPRDQCCFATPLVSSDIDAE